MTFSIITFAKMSRVYAPRATFSVFSGTYNKGDWACSQEFEIIYPWYYLSIFVAARSVHGGNQGTCFLKASPLEQPNIAVAFFFWILCFYFSPLCFADLLLYVETPFYNRWTLFTYMWTFIYAHVNIIYMYASNYIFMSQKIFPFIKPIYNW
jgi:hypothetical protein